MIARFRPRAGRSRTRVTATMSKAVSAVVAMAVLGTTATEAVAAVPAKPTEKSSFAQAMATLDAATASLPKPGATTKAPGPSRLDRMSADRDRQLVEDFAEFDEEEEVREAAKKALESDDPNAIREFLEHGEAEARKRAKDKKNGDDAENRKKIEAMRGTGGPHFNAEVERVLDAKPPPPTARTSWHSARRSRVTRTRRTRRPPRSGRPNSASVWRCSPRSAVRR